MSKTKKELPHSEEGEKGVIGSMLLSADIALELSGIMTPDDFYLYPNKVIFEKIIELRQSGVVVDLITLTQYLRDNGELEKVGDAPYVTDLFCFVPTASNYKYYVLMVKDAKLFRDMIERAEKTLIYAYRKEGFFSTPEILSRAQVGFGEMKVFDFTPPKTVGDLVHEKLERLQTGEADSDIVLTGIPDLDRYSPIRMGNLIVVKAKRKTGKSITAKTILENICVKNGLPGLYFSLEDPSSQVITRILSGISRVPMDKDHVSKMSELDIRRITDATAKIEQANLIIHDNVFDHSEMLAKAKRRGWTTPNLPSS